MNIERNGSLAGKVALVTGASRGIGAAVARAFSAAGACVALAARDEAALEQLRQAPGRLLRPRRREDVEEGLPLPRGESRPVRQQGCAQLLCREAPQACFEGPEERAEAGGDPTSHH